MKKRKSAQGGTLKIVQKFTFFQGDPCIGMFKIDIFTRGDPCIGISKMDNFTSGDPCVDISRMNNFTRD